MPNTTDCDPELTNALIIKPLIIIAPLFKLESLNSILSWLYYKSFLHGHGIMEKKTVDGRP